MKKSLKILTGIGFVAILLIAGCASTAPSAVPPTTVQAILEESFVAHPPAGMDRLQQTPLQRLCSAAAAANKPLDQASRAQLEKAAMDSIVYPADGNYLGDWREGEKIAQSGRGLQWSDKVGAPNGANCYACHQLSAKEISYGNMGPSLNHYAQHHGVTDPRDPKSLEMVRYTWGRIWNTNAFNACSGMPRFGDAHILTQQQIHDVMALLLDPQSPVNR